jgi:mannosyltransferase OCH1-like enzyme
MRYEILYRHGGVYADADSISVRPLDDWLLQRPMFAVWESEEHAPGLIANSFIGAVPGHPALAEMIRRIGQLKDPLNFRSWWRPRPKRTAPWKSTGPRLFTKVVSSQPRERVTILPSIMFLPQHFRDMHERESELIYARHFWSTTSVAKLSGRPI